MDWVYYPIAYLCFFIGILSCVYPVLPGVCFVMLGIIISAFAPSAPIIPWYLWAFWGVLTIFGSFVDQICAVMGAKQFGGSKAGMITAVVGTIVCGFFFFPFGLILGPFLGALAGELLIARKEISGSAKASLGAWLGFIAGSLMKLVIACIMGVTWILWMHFVA